MTTEQALKIAEALKALVEQTEAEGHWAIHINQLKEILEASNV